MLFAQQYTSPELGALEFFLVCAGLALLIWAASYLVKTIIFLLPRK